MEAILESKTSTLMSSQPSLFEQVKAASAPQVFVPPKEEKLAMQISAPSYLLSLKENEAPPFRKPEREPRPKLLIGTVMSEEEAILMIAAYDVDKVEGLKKFLGTFLVEKKIILNYNISEKQFLTGLLTETTDYAAQRDFSSAKLSCLITIYLSTHIYFKYYYWLSPVAVWGYFKEIMIRHTIEDSPDGQEVFSPEECYDIVTHFHSIYLSNLPLIHVLTFEAHRLKLLWPFKMK